jgi:predicted dehydrogenase
MKLRFGLVGAGGIGGIRARALEASPDCELTAVADPDQIRAHKVAGPCHATVFGDYRDLLEKAEVDAVLVCTPPQLHEPITLAAFERGKHVLCEKPLSNSVESAKRMVQAARDKGLTLATGFNHRYFGAVRLVKTAIESGEIGDLDHVRSFAGHVGVGELQGAPWLLDPKVMGGGALMDNGIHLLDLTRHVLGEVRSVMGAYSESVWQIPGAEGNGFALLRSTENRTATLQASWTEWRGYRFYVAAYGNRGTAWGYYAPMAGMVVTMDRPGGKPQRRYELFPKLNTREKLKGWQLNVVDTFVLEFRDFVALVHGDQRTIAEGFDGLRAVEMAHAVRQSFDENRSVELCSPF